MLSKTNQQFLQWLNNEYGIDPSSFESLSYSEKDVLITTYVNEIADELRD